MDVSELAQVWADVREKDRERQQERVEREYRRRLAQGQNDMDAFRAANAYVEQLKALQTAKYILRCPTPCSTCGAAAGERCVSRHGQRRSNHEGR